MPKLLIFSPDKPEQMKTTFIYSLLIILFLIAFTGCIRPMQIAGNILYIAVMAGLAGYCFYRLDKQRN